jgi:hypothetical protein
LCQFIERALDLTQVLTVRREILDEVIGQSKGTTKVRRHAQLLKMNILDSIVVQKHF